MSITAHPVPHSIATFIADGGSPLDLSGDARLELLDLLQEIGSVTVDLHQEPHDEALPLLEAIASPDGTRPWWEQWEIELTCIPLLRATVEDMLTIELL